MTIYEFFALFFGIWLGHIAALGVMCLIERHRNP